MKNYKAWDKVNKEIVDISFIDFKNKAIVSNYWRYGNSKLLSFEDVDFIECTNMRDRDGSLIYDGDILRFEDKLGTYYSYVYQEPSGEWKVDGLSLYDYSPILEKVGNKFENHNLLKESN
ncbi:hypothetical protein HOR18_gp032 [Staphylococcus phage vB_SscM-1]|uniref:YopX protein domain-containing protein n=3 Tax=Sciuriunavirus TaxID=2732971 RepID=A0A1X9I9C9_9CAUD|nr:hypothetical protein HOR18_gp032 [Staphylococcus phage vB_SscM-1]ANT44695.1 hypothetical protein vB_SscM-1_032 [Staphylococcus phage vB_SscM-1]ANT44898.1 hypothetical protein vB_SscM-2_031 [Staphylococcus phage vB_SscM-2]QQV88420.1 hypothetical protein [Staphylococcus phage ZCSS1]